MMNKEEELRKELKYLINSEIDKEIELNRVNLTNNNVDIKSLANDIYLKHGVDINRIKSNPLGFLNTNNKNKAITEIVITIIILLLFKIPFDFVRDIGYDYISVLSTNKLLYNLWNLLFLIAYTVAFVSFIIYSIKNINKKYNN